MASLPEWRGLFNWSMKYQDGTTPTDFTGVDFSAEKMAWCVSELPSTRQKVPLPIGSSTHAAKLTFG